MVVGAGRGPLVRAALNAADIAKKSVRVYAVEKNPNAVLTWVFALLQILCYFATICLTRIVFAFG